MQEPGAGNAGAQILIKRIPIISIRGPQAAQIAAADAAGERSGEPHPPHVLCKQCKCMHTLRKRLLVWYPLEPLTQKSAAALSLVFVMPGADRRQQPPAGAGQMPQKNRGKGSRAEDTSSTRNAAEGRRKATEAYKGKGIIRRHHKHRKHSRDNDRGRSRAGTRKEHHAMERNQATDTEEREGRRRYLHWAADNLTDEQTKAADRTGRERRTAERPCYSYRLLQSVHAAKPESRP